MISISWDRKPSDWPFEQYAAYVVDYGQRHGRFAGETKYYIRPADIASSSSHEIFDGRLFLNLSDDQLLNVDAFYDKASPKKEATETEMKTIIKSLRITQ